MTSPLQRRHDIQSNLISSIHEIKEPSSIDSKEIVNDEISSEIISEDFASLANEFVSLGSFSIDQGGIFQCHLSYNEFTQELTHSWTFGVALGNKYSLLREILLNELQVSFGGLNPIIDISISGHLLLRLQYDPKSKTVEKTFSRLLLNHDLKLFNQEGLSHLKAVKKRANYMDVKSFEVDLHTHFGGAITLDMFKTALKTANEPVPYPVKCLDEMGICYKATMDSTVNLNDENAQIDWNKFFRHLILDPYCVSSFTEMEKVYTYRAPIVKCLHLFPVFLELLAKEYQRNGVKYVELSISDILKPEWMKIAIDVLPRLEKKYKVRMVFLAALWRHSPEKYNLDLIEQVKAYLKANNPYLVGVDYMGEEDNSTLDFVPQLDILNGFKEFRPDFVMRVHAGESPCHPENASVAIEHGATRLGHGLFMDKKAEEEAAKKNVRIECNISSNLALNSAVKGSEIPLRSWLENGIIPTFGTDGHGCYCTTPALEAVLAHQLGLSEKSADAIRERDREYVAMMSEYYDYRIKEYSSDSFLPALPEPQCPPDEWSKIAAKKKEDKQLIVDFIDASQTIRQIEYSSLDSFFDNRVPILFAGATSVSWKPVPEDDRMKIKNQIERLFENLDEKKVVIITGGTDFGMEELVHQVVAKLSKQGRRFALLGALAVPLQAKPEEVSPALTHATIIDGPWNYLGPRMLEVLSRNDGMAFFMTGGYVVKNMIQISKNLGGIDYWILNDVVGTPKEMAKVVPDRAFSKNDALENVFMRSSRAQLMRSMTVDADGANQYFSTHIRKEVLMFLGYSTEYADEDALREQLRLVLKNQDPEKTIVVAGATEIGIGAVYKIAKEMGFQTLGVVSTTGRKSNNISPDADFVLYVEGSERWGGYMPGTQRLTPTSEVIVKCSHVVVMCGGGDTARIEANEIERRGVSVIRYPMKRKTELRASL